MKMQAWLIQPDGKEERLSIEYHDGILGELSKKYFDDSTLDLTRVRYKGRLCHMAVDDDGHCKGLPANEAATKLYLANCYPGTTHYIVGPVVVFGGLLP
jgi:hypothetical protein